MVTLLRGVVTLLRGVVTLLRSVVTPTRVQGGGGGAAGAGHAAAAAGATRDLSERNAGEGPAAGEARPLSHALTSDSS